MPKVTDRVTVKIRDRVSVIVMIHSPETGTSFGASCRYRFPAPATVRCVILFRYQVFTGARLNMFNSVPVTSAKVEL